MRGITKKSLTIICALAFICSAIGVYAVPQIISNSVNITVVSSDSTIILTVDKNFVVSGQPVVFTATLNPAVAGVNLVLCLNGSPIAGASAVTNAAGVAVITYTPTASGAYTVVTV